MSENPHSVRPVLLSGGSGSRLWPLSRASRPKQFLAFNSHSDAGAGLNMLGATAARLSGPGFEAPIVVANIEHRFLAAEALRAAGVASEAILLEPEGRNTAAAVAVAALAAAQRDPQALVLAAPSDHLVDDVAAFRAAVTAAMPAAASGRLVTFGVTPNRPETGFGYIEAGAPLPADAGGPGLSAIARFVEKPDRARAEAFLASGRFSWNAGLFLFRVDALLAEFEALAPDILTAAQGALAQARADLDFLRLDAAAFAAAPAQPFDVAIMEKTARGAVLPIDVGWSDLGSWRGLWEIGARDSAGNVGVGDAVFEDCADSLALSAGQQLVALVGARNLAVVATDDAVLVAPMAETERVKELVAELRAAGRPEADAARQVMRPWGSYTGVDRGDGFLVKRIEVRPGATLSLQYHRHRAEHWVVVRGVATVTRGDDVFKLRANESTYIPLGVVHRLANEEDAPLVMIEVQTGGVLDEEDIVRLDDTYGRLEAT